MTPFRKNPMAVDLEELSRKTGLVVRSADSSALTELFARLEEYDSDERANNRHHTDTKKVFDQFFGAELILRPTGGINQPDTPVIEK
jgi:hypothetical protein